MSSSNSLPVDIQYKKMLEWLTDRGLLSKTWNKNYKRLRNSIAAALKKDASCDSVKKYLADHKSASTKGESDYESFTYFHAKDVFELYLAYCKADDNDRNTSKSLFNNYNDTDLSTWDNIIHSYKTNNIFMGEAARVMKHNTVYEIPALRKNIARVEKRVGDIDRKIADYDKAIADSLHNLRSKCDDLQIKGISYRSELMSRASDLVPALQVVHKDIQVSDLNLACKFYTIFSTYISDPTYFSGDDVNMKTDTQFSAIKTLIEDEVNESIGKTADAAATHELSGVEGDIDWGDMMNQLGGGESSSANVDEGNSGEIDWSSMMSSTDIGNTVKGDSSSSNDVAVEIDWSSMLEVESQGITQDNLSQDKYILLSSDFRQTIMNELVQLKTFYVHRIFEMSDQSGNDNSLLTSGDSNLPQLIRNSNLNTMNSFLEVVQRIMDSLTDSALQQLFAIYTGGAAFDRIVNDLQAIDLQVNKLRKLKDKLVEERSVLSQETRDNNAKLKRLIKDTVGLKVNIESALSSHYNGRNVKIVGDINSLH